MDATCQNQALVAKIGYSVELLNKSVSLAFIVHFSTPYQFKALLVSMLLYWTYTKSLNKFNTFKKILKDGFILFGSFNNLSLKCVHFLNSILATCLEPKCQLAETKYYFHIKLLKGTHTVCFSISSYNVN